MTNPVCMDCIHCDTESNYHPTCTHPSSLHIDVVTGKESFGRCWESRLALSGNCKREAIHFTQKEAPTTDGFGFLKW